MDDFDYSVQISEQDWDSFFQVCEECDFSPPGLARQDESATSDNDEVDSIPLTLDICCECPMDGPPDSEGPPADNYTKIRSPQCANDILSGSEEDSKYFERNKSPTLFQEYVPIALLESSKGFTSAERLHCQKIEQLEPHNLSIAPCKVLQSTKADIPNLREPKAESWSSELSSNERICTTRESLFVPTIQENHFLQTEYSSLRISKPQASEIDLLQSDILSNHISTDLSMQSSLSNINCDSSSFIYQVTEQKVDMLDHNHDRNSQDISLLDNKSSESSVFSMIKRQHFHIEQEKTPPYFQNVEVATMLSGEDTTNFVIRKGDHSYNGNPKSDILPSVSEKEWPEPCVSKEASKAFSNPGVSSIRSYGHCVASEHYTHPSHSTEMLPESNSEEMYFFLDTLHNADSPQPENSLDSAHPVYAISSFWDEMEKLTINDILRLRLVSNAQQNHFQDHPDSTDSGFFTQPDDSKLDHSSGDVSALSDFEEEFSLLTNSNPIFSPDLLNPGNQSKKFGSCGVLWESGPDHVEKCDNPYSKLNTGIIHSQHLVSDYAEANYRKMCKTISVQNLQALEVEPQAVSHQECLLEHENTTSAVAQNFLSLPSKHDGTVELSQPESISGCLFTQITFPEMCEYFFNESENEHNQVDALSPSSTLAETYDYFFSDFDDGSFFSWLTVGSGKSQKDLVPIFSCSRSSQRTIHCSEEHDYFPYDLPTKSDDEELALTEIQVTSHFDITNKEQADSTEGVDMYEHFFAGKEWNEELFWRSPFSLRRIRLTDWLGSTERSSQWELASTGQRIPQIVQSSENMYISSPPCIHDVESWILQQIEEQQRRHGGLQVHLGNPKVDRSLLSLQQSDMCLICIAFASWVLKSISPQAADSWKAALLANISTLSAIQYLRRYVREEPKNKP